MERQISLQHTEVDVREVSHILEGRLENLPPITSKMVRVFLSSTFSDMVQERNALMESTYPELKEFCRDRYGLEFQMVDLRWGIREESQDDHTIIHFCLSEIENCKKMSIGPTFVALIGQKYGYRPFPPHIDAREFEALREALINDDNDVELLDTWYHKDNNEIPSVYKLQPISTLLPHYTSKDNEEYRERDQQIWGKVFNQIQRLLRMGAMLCVKSQNLTVREKEKYFISVTEYELEVGMFNKEDNQKDCLCFFREIRNLKEQVRNDRAPRFIDVIPGQKVMDHDAQRYLNILKNDKIPRKLDESCVEYLEHWWKDPDNCDPSEDEQYLQRFCKTFRDRLKKLIIKNANDAQSNMSSSYVTEILQHLGMCNQRRAVFRGRQDILERVLRYIRSDSTNHPLVIYGESGTGKTSVMAKVASLVREWMPESYPTVILRFLGTTARSCSIRLVLGNLCWQIASLYKKDITSIPGDYPRLVKYFQEILKSATEEKPIVMILDSLDQLTTTHRAHNLAWLPTVLPKHVKLIISTLPIDNDILKNLKSILNHEENFIRVLPLGMKLSCELVREWLQLANKTLTTDQFGVVEKALGKCSLPLYSRLIFEEVCRWHSFSPMSVTKLEPNIKGVINVLFDRVEKYFGHTFVKHALSYLTASKNGLSDVEIEDIMSLDDVVLNDVFVHWLPPTRRIPPLLWPRLHNELAAYVIQREVNGTMVFYWYHRQFIQVAQERYLKDVGHKLYIHSSLAHFFQGIWGGGKGKAFTYSNAQMNLLNLDQGKGEADRKVPEQPLIFGSTSGNTRRGKKLAYNLRKLSELPFHLVEARRQVDMKKEVLFNYEWLHTKLRAMSLPDLLSDFQYAMEHNITDQEIQILSNALRVGGSHVNNNPDTLAFDLVGRLLPYYDTHMNIRNLIQQCDRVSINHSVLQPMFPCYESPSGMLLYILEDHTQHVYDLIFSGDSNELISIGKDNTVIFWDLGSGERTRTIDIPELKPGPNTKLYLSSDGKYLVVDSDAINSPVHVYDVKTGHLLHSCGKRLATQRRGFLVGHLLCRQKNIIDIRKGKVIKTLDDFLPTKAYLTCSMTPDGEYILIGEEKSIKLFDFKTGQLKKTFHTENLPCMFNTTSDSKYSYVGFAEDCLFKVLDICPESRRFGEVVQTFNYKAAFPHAKFLEGPRFGKELAEISVSPTDEKIVLLNIKRCHLVVYKIDNKSGPSAILMDAKAIHATNKTFLFGSRFSSDACHVIAGVEHYLHVWNSVSGALVSTLTLHSVYKYPLAVSKKSNLIATGSLIHTAIKVWDLGKLQANTEGALKVYENPVDMVATTPGDRVAYIKKYYGLSSGKGYKYLDSFGIDVWNLCTGQCETLLQFERYGRLLQMSVSIDGQKIALLLSNREEAHVHVANLRTNKVQQSVSHQNCKSFSAAPMWNYFATCGTKDGSAEVKLWDMAAGTEVITFGSALCPVFTLDCQHMLYIDKGERIISYSLSKYAPAAQLLHQCDRLQMIPNKHHVVMTTRYPRTKSDDEETDDNANLEESEEQEEFAEVSVWYYSSGKKLFTLESVAPNGILDITKDGKFAVDGYLQVHDLKTGNLHQDLNCRHGSDVEHTFARFTFDGKYVVWVDGLSVKASRVSDGKMLANISTHEKPTSLEMVEFGYVVILGREDGHVLIMKLVPNAHAEEGRILITSRLDRARALWEKPTVAQSAIVTLDPLYQKVSRWVKDSELPKLGDEVRHGLQQKAKVPAAIIKTTSMTDMSIYDTLGRSKTTLRRGSSPMSWLNGSRSRESSPSSSPPAHEGKSTFFAGSLRDSLDLSCYQNGTVERLRRGSSPYPYHGSGVSPEDSPVSMSPIQGSPVIRARKKVNRKRSKSVQDLQQADGGKQRSKSFQERSTRTKPKVELADLVQALEGRPIPMPGSTPPKPDKKEKKGRRKSPGISELLSTSRVVQSTSTMVMGLMNIGSSMTLPNRKKPPIPPKKKSFSRKSDSDLPIDNSRDRTPSV